MQVNTMASPTTAAVHIRPVSSWKTRSLPEGPYGIVWADTLTNRCSLTDGVSDSLSREAGRVKGRRSMNFFRVGRGREHLCLPERSQGVGPAANNDVEGFETVASLRSGGIGVFRAV